VLLLASIDAPPVERDAILLRERLHLCFGEADVIEVKRERAHDDEHLAGLRRILFVTGGKHFRAQLLQLSEIAEEGELNRVGLTSL